MQSVYWVICLKCQSKECYDLADDYLLDIIPIWLYSVYYIKAKKSTVIDSATHPLGTLKTYY